MNPQLIILAVALAMSGACGWRVTAWYYEAEISDMRADKAKSALEASEANRKIELMALDLSAAISERDAARNRQARVVELETTKEVIRYVQNPAIPRCDLPPDWVRIHDTAAGSELPENAGAARAVDGNARAVTDADALQIVSVNYAIYHRTKNQLIALQEWARGLQELKS